MNDFQKKNRSGNDKRFDPTKRTYPSNATSYNSQYWSSDKQGTKDRHKPAPNRKFSEMEQQTNILAELVADMKGLLESIYQSNKRLTEMEERRMEADERQTAALEKIAEYLVGGRDIAPLHVNAQTAVSNDPEESKDAQPVQEATENPNNDPEESKDAQPAQEATENPVNNDDEGISETSCSGKPDDDEKRKIILMIQERRETGLSYGQIASQFSDEKIPTFSGKGNWHAQTVQKIGKMQPDEI